MNKYIAELEFVERRIVNVEIEAVGRGEAKNIAYAKLNDQRVSRCACSGQVVHESHVLSVVNAPLPDNVQELGRPLQIVGSSWDGHCESPIDWQRIPRLSIRALRILRDDIGVKTFGDFLSIDAERLGNTGKCGIRTVYEIIKCRDEVFLATPDKYKPRTVPFAAEADVPLPAAKVGLLSVRARRFLVRNNITTYAQLFKLTPEDIKKAECVGVKTVKELMRFASECGADDGVPHGEAVEPVDPSNFDSFADFVMGGAGQEVAGKIGPLTRDVICSYLALGECQKKQSSAEVGMRHGVGGMRICQVAHKAQSLLFGEGRDRKYAAFADAVLEMVKAKGGELRIDELLAGIDARFGWQGTSLVNVTSLMKNLGISVVEKNGSLRLL